jgi:hypothetical protein
MTPTPAREGLPELPEAVAYRHDIAWVDGLGDPTFSTKPPKPVNGPMAKCVVSETVSSLYTAAQMHQFREEGIAAYIASQPTQVGGDIWPAIDKMLVAAYEHGLNHEPMDMMAMQRRFAALPRPQPEPQPATGGEFCLICDMPSGDVAYCSTCASVSIGEAWANRPGQSKTTQPPPSDAAQGDKEFADHMDTLEYVERVFRDEGSSRMAESVVRAARFFAASRPVRVDEVLTVLDLLRTDRNGKKWDCIQSASGSMVDVSRLLAAHKGEGNG